VVTGFGILEAQHHVGQGQHADAGRKRRDVVDREDREIQQAHGGVIDGVLLGAKLAVEKQRAGMSAAGIFHERGDEGLAKRFLGAAGAIADRDLEILGRGRSRRDQRRQRDRRAETRQFSNESHAILPRQLKFPASGFVIPKHDGAGIGRFNACKNVPD
jgi:hypothetical protein